MNSSHSKLTNKTAFNNILYRERKQWAKRDWALFEFKGRRGQLKLDIGKCTLLAWKLLFYHILTNSEGKLIAVSPYFSYQKVINC